MRALVGWKGGRDRVNGGNLLHHHPARRHSSIRRKSDGLPCASALRHRRYRGLSNVSLVTRARRHVQDQLNAPEGNGIRQCPAAANSSPSVGSGSARRTARSRHEAPSPPLRIFLSYGHDAQRGTGPPHQGSIWKSAGTMSGSTRARSKPATTGGAPSPTASPAATAFSPSSRNIPPATPASASTKSPSPSA